MKPIFVSSKFMPSTQRAKATRDHHKRLGVAPTPHGSTAHLITQRLSAFPFHATENIVRYEA